MFPQVRPTPVTADRIPVGGHMVTFWAGVNDRRGVGPPARGPELLLLIGLSSRTATTDGLDMINGFLVLALRTRRTCSERLASPKP